MWVMKDSGVMWVMKDSHRDAIEKNLREPRCDGIGDWVAREGEGFRARFSRNMKEHSFQLVVGKVAGAILSYGLPCSCDVGPVIERPGLKSKLKESLYLAGIKSRFMGTVLAMQMDEVSLDDYRGVVPLCEGCELEDVEFPVDAVFTRVSFDDFKSKFEPLQPGQAGRISSRFESSIASFWGLLLKEKGYLVKVTDYGGVEYNRPSLDEEEE